MQHVLLEVMASLKPWDDLPWEWADPLIVVLKAADARAANLAAIVVSGQPPKKRQDVRSQLRILAGETSRPASVRLPLLLACGGELTEEEFQLVAGALGKSLSDETDVSALAARILSRAALKSGQLIALIPLLPQAGLTQRPLLLRAYASASDEALGLTLVDTLQDSGTLASFSADDLRECLGKFPANVLKRLAAARAALTPDAANQRARLAYLEKSLPVGDAQRGKVVFQSAKASCVLCHQAGYLGKHFGPDLTKIGSIRTRRDLLEAIVFPSASFVRSYEPVEVKRKDGTLAYGIITNESAAALTLATGAVTPPATVNRADIAELKPGTASLMPQGLDQILAPQELADVIAFLLSMK